MPALSSLPHASSGAFPIFVHMLMTFAAILSLLKPLMIGLILSRRSRLLQKKEVPSTSPAPSSDLMLLNWEPMCFTSWLQPFLKPWTLSRQWRGQHILWTDEHQAWTRYYISIPEYPLICLNKLWSLLSFLSVSTTLLSVEADLFYLVIP